MNDQNSGVKPELALSSTDLSYERTIMSLERTLLSWIRTATSMISFGFTIYKFFEEMSDKAGTRHGIFTPRMVGMMMILFGFIGLLLAYIQHINEVKKIRKSYAHVATSVSSLLAFLILFFGLILFLAALFRQ